MRTPVTVSPVPAARPDPAGPPGEPASRRTPSDASDASEGADDRLPACCDESESASGREPGMAVRPLDRVAVRLLEALMRRRWGFAPTVVRPMVEQLGPAQSIRWLMGGNRRYETTLRTLGPLRTHVACTAIALLKGCRYCAYGHAYAVELHHLQLNDRLFPVDATTVAEWAGLPRAELRARLRDTLVEAELPVELIWVDRALELADGGRPIDEQEARIKHLVRILDNVTAVSLPARPAFDEAHDRLNKDVELRSRLAALRAARTA